MSSVSLRTIRCLKMVMTQFLTEEMPLVEGHLESSCDVRFSYFETGNLLNFECDYFLGFLVKRLKCL